MKPHEKFFLRLNAFGMMLVCFVILAKSLSDPNEAAQIFCIIGASVAFALLRFIEDQPLVIDVKEQSDRKDNYETGC